MLKRRLIWLGFSLVALVAVLAAVNLTGAGPAQFVAVFTTMSLLAVALVGLFWPYRHKS